jgi:GR25 family glycosyltransferase involved in LPS biosynthesis
LEPLKYELFEAVDGKKLKPLPKILKLFETGDYNYRHGILGCALSHVQLWYELITQPECNAMLILEDDITLSTNFTDKLSHLVSQLPNDWDVLFLGHFLYSQYVNREKDREDILPTAQKWTRQECIQKSMGGTIGYLISKKGAIQMYMSLNQTGMYNCVDWIMFKTADTNNIYYSYPHIVFSECHVNDKVDSDIQYDYSSMCRDDVERLKHELKFWINELKCKGVNYIDNEVKDCYISHTEHDESSSIIVTDQYVLDKTILTHVCFIKIKNNFKEYHDYIDTIKRLPVKFYIIKNLYIVIVPVTVYRKNNIQKNITLDRQYLNIDNPV